MRKILISLFILIFSISLFATIHFSVTEPTIVDYGTHKRVYFTIDYDGLYPFSSDQDAMIVYFAKDHSIGDELPQFDYYSVYFPISGWNRTFWIVEPRLLEGQWHLRIDAVDKWFNVIATTGEIKRTFHEDIIYMDTIPYLFASGKYLSAIALVNDMESEVQADLLFYSLDNESVEKELTLEPDEIYARWISDIIPEYYNMKNGFYGYVKIESSNPLKWAFWMECDKGVSYIYGSLKEKK